MRVQVWPLAHRQPQNASDAMQQKFTCVWQRISVAAFIFHSRIHVSHVNEYVRLTHHEHRLKNAPSRKGPRKRSLRWYSTSSRDTIRYRARLLGWQTAQFNGDAAIASVNESDERGWWCRWCGWCWCCASRTRPLDASGDVGLVRAYSASEMRGFRTVGKKTNEIPFTLQLDIRENKCAAFASHVYFMPLVIWLLYYKVSTFKLTHFSSKLLDLSL